MKINKRGSQSSGNAQHLLFHSRKNSLKEPSSTSQLAMAQNLQEKAYHSGMPISSESQPVLLKGNDKQSINAMSHKRNPSHTNSQQLPPNEVNGTSYMLKLQKYKKMKTELNQQTKQILKKCLNPGTSTTSSKIGSCNTTTNAQPYKHCVSQQIMLNQVDQSVKENSNQAANTLHLLTNSSSNAKASTIKFSINNLLNEISQKAGPSHSVTNSANNTMSGQQNSFQNVLASKNHTSLMQSKNQAHQQQLASSKMMKALHKKCNSIVNGSTASVLNSVNSQYKGSSNTTCVEEGTIDKKRDQQQDCMSQESSQRNSFKKNLSQISQIEFFDENVRVNQVPQITPRNGQSRKMAPQPNDRYKEVDYPKTVKNQYKSESQNLLTESLKPQGGHQIQTAKINLIGGKIQKIISDESCNPRESGYQTKRTIVQDENQPPNKKVFEMKRRSCGAAEQIQAQHPTDKSVLMQSQKVSGLSHFAQRKYSQQIPEHQQFQSKPEQILKHYSQQQVPQTARDKQINKKLNPKEEIISFIGKYIKQNQPDHKSKDQLTNQAFEQQETLQNLKDFLQYLEDKNIINTKKLENNREEMTNLIQDLMKLDLNKFSSKAQAPNTQSSTCKNSPANGQFSMRRNSADQVVVIDAEKAPFLAGMSSPLNVNNRYQSNLPMNSPQTNDGNIVCYYSPVNVNGNGNIVNTNVQIYPANAPLPNKKYQNSSNLFIAGSEIQDNQDIPLRVTPQGYSHKRVNSQAEPSQLMHSQQSNSQKSTHRQAKVMVNSNYNFAFGSSSNQQESQPTISKIKDHFHQRKHSMFVQGENKHAHVKNYQTVEKDNGQEDDDVAICSVVPEKSRLTHRRATTNLIKPTSLHQNPVQTLQPQVVSAKAVFHDDIGLIEERDKLIKYVKLYTSKKVEVPETTLDYYKFVKLIGKGAFGKVTLGIHKLTGKQVAIKTVDKSLMKDDYQRRKVLQEVYLLKKVRHSNVIRLLEVFESPKHLLMVMEYAGGGDLLQYVKKRRRLDETEARRIFRQIVYGLAHCHCRSVLHRDIKLDNILLDNDGEIKICDFGVSRVIKKNQRITEQCGTPAYIAPEIISDSGYEGFTADVWSLGVLLYAMVCGTVPFKAQNMHDLHNIITNGSFAFPPQVEGLLTKEVKNLITQMLILDPNDRISIPEILSHPWMTSQDQMFGDDMEDFQDFNKDFMSGLSGQDTTEADINNVNIDNLFTDNKYKTKLSYTDYCAITQDFATMHMDEEALQVLEGLGFPRKLVREGLNKGELNHATASYNLMVLS